MNIKHIAFGSALIVNSLPSFANSNFDFKCETNISGEMSFENNVLTINSTNKDSIVFAPSGEVTVNNKTLSLNSE